MHGVSEIKGAGTRCELVSGPEVTRARRSILPRKPLTEEQSRLVEEHWEFAQVLALVFRNRYPSVSVDWEGEASIGICQAALSWDPTGKASFRTHADRRIKGAIVDAMRQCGLRGYGRSRKYRGAPRVLSLDEPAVLEPWSRTHAHLLQSDDEPTGWELDSEDEVRGLTRRLPPKHQAVLRALYLRGDAVTMKQAGHAVGLSESRVSQIHDQAIGYLREALGV